MVRRLIATAVVLCLGLSTAYATEAKKGAAPPRPTQEKKAAAVKPAAPAVSPAVQQINALKEELKKALAKRAAAHADLGKAQTEALKAKHLLATAEGNAADCKRHVENLEKKLTEAMAQVTRDAKAKFAREKAESEAKRMLDLSRKVAELEQEVRSLKGKLDSQSKKATPVSAKRR